MINILTTKTEIGEEIAKTLLLKRITINNEARYNTS